MRAIIAVGPPTLSILVLTCATILQARRVNAQVIPDRISCVSCRIEVTPAVSIETSEDAFWLRDVEGRAVALAGGEFVVHDRMASKLAFVSGDGRLRRMHGRKGAGPGEFGAISAIVSLPEDSIAVFDWENARASVLDPALHTTATWQLPFLPGPRVVPLRDGTFLLNGDVRSPERIGQPLHTVDRRGVVLRSFGAGRGAFRPDVPYLTSRAIATGSGDRVFAAWRNVFQIDEFDVTRGLRARSLVRQSSWFTPTLRPERNGHTDEPAKPTPFIFAIQFEPPGRLWVLVGVADSRWRDAIERTDAGTIVADEHRYYDTVIEVIDLATARVLTRRRVDQHLKWFAGPGLVGTTTLDADGVPEMRIYRVELLSGTSRENE